MFSASDRTSGNHCASATAAPRRSAPRNRRVDRGRTGPCRAGCERRHRGRALLARGRRRLVIGTPSWGRSRIATSHPMRADTRAAACCWPSSSKAARACSRSTASSMKPPTNAMKAAGSSKPRSLGGRIGELAGAQEEAARRCVAASASARLPARTSMSRAFARIASASSASGASRIRLEVVGGDDLHDLVLVAGPAPFDVLAAARCRAFGPAWRACRRRPSGRATGGTRTGRARGARVGLDAQQLLANEGGQERLELSSGRPRERRERLRVNVLPRTAASCSSARSSGGSPSSRAAMRAWRDSGTSSSPTGAGELEAGRLARTSSPGRAASARSRPRRAGPLGALADLRAAARPAARGPCRGAARPSPRRAAAPGRAT